jgi:hypothetical protein
VRWPSTLGERAQEVTRRVLAERAQRERHHHFELDLLCAAGSTDEVARNRARFLAR